MKKIVFSILLMALALPAFAQTGPVGGAMQVQTGYIPLGCAGNNCTPVPLAVYLAPTLGPTKTFTYAPGTNTPTKTNTPTNTPTYTVTNTPTITATNTPMSVHETNPPTPDQTKVAGKAEQLSVQTSAQGSTVNRVVVFPTDTPTGTLTPILTATPINANVNNWATPDTTKLAGAAAVWTAAADDLTMRQIMQYTPTSTVTPNQTPAPTPGNNYPRFNDPGADYSLFWLYNFFMGGAAASSSKNATGSAVTLTTTGQTYKYWTAEILGVGGSNPATIDAYIWSNNVVPTSASFSVTGAGNTTTVGFNSSPIIGNAMSISIRGLGATTTIQCNIQGCN